jgi:hypothetical protein
MRKAHPLRLSAAAAIALAVWLAWPSRNVHGNPLQEKLLSQCVTANGMTVRLYEGNGGATTAYWYTVTTQGGVLDPERQVLFTYASPALESVACAGSGIRVAGELRTFSFPEVQIRALRDQPLALWRGVEKSGVTVQPMTITRYVLAAALSVVALVLLVLARRRPAAEADAA